MSFHYKYFFNNSDENEYCWMHDESDLKFSSLRENETFTSIKYLPKWFTIAGRTYAHLVCYSGLVLNFLIATALLRNRNLRKESLTPCVLSINFANIFLYICGLGYKLSKYVLSPKTQTRCHTFGMAGFVMMLCSAANLFAIASLRCVKFNCAKKFENETFKIASVLTAITSWIAACLVVMPTAIGVWGQFGWECKSKRCRFINRNNDGIQLTTEPEKMYYILLILMGIVSLLMNLGTYVKVKEDCKKLLSEIEDFDQGAAASILNKEKRATLMLVIDTAQYLICFLPKAILHLKDPDSPNKEPLTHLIFFTLWYTSGLIEAVVILSFQKKYRNEIKTLFQFICPFAKQQSIPCDSRTSKIRMLECRKR